MPAKQANVLLVTVTKAESKAVLGVFHEATNQEATPFEIERRTYFDLGLVNGARVCLTQSEMGTGGLDGAMQSVLKGIDSLAPSAVIMVGIAFGVDEGKQAIGDVLVSENLRCYDLQRVGTHEGEVQIVLRGDRPHCSAWLLNRLKSADLRWDGAPVHFGVLLTGDKLVDNFDYREQLRGFEPEAIGGEMEGAGLYAACQDKKVDWILVKAICDWADGNKAQDKGARQQCAAMNAAKFVLHALQFTPFERTGPSSDTASAETAAHSSLPTQPFFFGREKELAIVADAILPESRTWGVLIDGPGGIGKTALAVRAGHLAPAATYPRKIFLSAKVRELTAAGEQRLQDFMLPKYLELLSELARELGEENIARAPEDERPNTVRRALSDKHALIVIDNVETFPEEERVRLYQFLTRLPSGCKAIVTSRRRSDVDARIIRLDRLEAKDALALMVELSKTNRHLAAASVQERQTLYEVTRGNPLMLRWTIGQLGRPGSQCRTVAEACAYLRNAPRDNDPLEYIFGDLLDTFSPSETAVLAALTHFTGPAPVTWIADLANLAERQAEIALEDLADRALLVGDPGGGAFYLPPLAAKFLRDNRPEAVTQTGDRLADRAYALALENGYENHERFPVLEAEWPALAAALPRLVQDESTRLQELCRAVEYFLDFSGRWDDMLSLEKQAEEKAVAANDLDNAGARAYRAGWVCYMRGQVAEVLACAARAEVHWKTANAGPRAAAVAIRLRGLGHRLEGDYAAAREAFRQNLDFFRTISPESSDVASALSSLAEAERLSRDYAAAERACSDALRIATKAGDREGVAIYTGNLGQLAMDREDWPAAEELSRKALALAEGVGRQELIASDCSQLATVVARQGRREEGLPYAQRAVAIYTNLRSPDLAGAQAALKECESPPDSG